MSVRPIKAPSHTHTTGERLNLDITLTPLRYTDGIYMHAVIRLQRPVAGNHYVHMSTHTHTLGSRPCVSHLTCPAGHRDARPSLSLWRCSPASRRLPHQPATAP